MPLRSDPSLWFNLPGIQAAYMPVRCPGGSLLARYNIAMGGQNRYRAELGVLPAWSPVTGWTFDGATQYLTTGIVPGDGWAMIARFSNGVWDGANQRSLAGELPDSGNTQFRLVPMRGTTGNNRIYSQGGGVATGVRTSAGIMAISGQQGYFNGVADGGLIPAWSGTNLLQIHIGRQNHSAIYAYWNGNIQAVAIYARTLLAAEVWTASRQMAYCDVNPDWSAWSRKRRYYYGPQVAAVGLTRHFAFYQRQRQT